MRDGEQAIEQVLAGLREAEIPQGMEGRILRAIEERSREPKCWALRTWMKMPGYSAIAAGGVFVAGVLLVVMVVPSVRKTAQVEAGRRTFKVAAGLRTLDATAGDEETDVPQQLKLQVQSKGYGTAEAVPLSKANLSKWVSSKAGLSEIGSSSSALANPPVIETGKAVGTFQDGNTAEGIPDYDALAVSEMLAPSKPAPPLPLTRQETLLAQVVHKGEPEALATLRSDLRAKQMEISKAEFLDFFEPAPVKANE